MRVTLASSALLLVLLAASAWVGWPLLQELLGEPVMGAFRAVAPLGGWLRVTLPLVGAGVARSSRVPSTSTDTTLLSCRRHPRFTGLARTLPGRPLRLLSTNRESNSRASR